MEEKHSLEKTMEHFKEYIEMRVDLIKHDTSFKIISIVSSVSTVIVISLLSIFILLFLSVGIVYWITYHSVQASMGFLVVAGFYLLFAIFLFKLRKYLIESRVIKYLLKKLYNVDKH